MTNGPSKPPSSTKLLFQLIQCLHHLLVLNTGSGGATRAFGRKARELDGFIRPAMPTQSAYKLVREVNDVWVKNMTQALITHYQSQMDFLQGALMASKLSKTDLAFATNKAKEWAIRNFGKRLQMATLSKFDQVVKNLCSLKPSDRPVPSPKTVPTKPVPNPSGDLLPGSVARETWTVATSKKRKHSLSPPSSSPSQTQAAKRVFTSPKTVQKPPSFSDKVKSPPRANGSNPKPAPKPKVFRFPNLKGKGLNSVWEIPSVAKDILVLGDSNLSRVTWIAFSSTGKLVCI